MDLYRGRAFAATAAVAIVIGLPACGSSSRVPAANSGYTSPSTPSNAVPNLHGHVIAPQGYVKYDADNDLDDHSTTPSKEDEREMVLASRHSASPVDRRAVSATIRAYMQAAAAGDGGKGCALLTSTLAEATAGGAPAGVAKTCPATLARLFRQQHAHLAVEEVGSLVVTGVHVLANVGFATLGFHKAVETELLLQREGGKWKINALADSTLP